jgi:group I intron endonuclease
MNYTVENFLTENNPIKGVGYVYKITSPTNRVYIGQSINLRARINKYRQINCKGQIRIYNSLLKYGTSNHKLEILETITSNIKEELDLLECYYIGLFDCLNLGLNSHIGGANKIPNEATKLKMSEAQKNRDKSTYKRGHKLSESHKEKLSKAKIGKRASEETRKKQSKVHTGRIAWNKGMKSINGKISKLNIINAN